MKKSAKIRYIIFKILIEIYKKNKNFDEVFEGVISKNNLDLRDKSLIFNVCQNTMRYNLHSKIILNKFIKKKLKTTQYILLISAVTQIVFLNFKTYAVVYDTVDVSRHINLFPGFINAVLQKVAKEKEDLNKTKISKKDLPVWFQEELKNNKDFDLKNFLISYVEEPSLHIVFKSKKVPEKLKEEIEFSSEKSAFIKFPRKIENIIGYKEGFWWVQNFSSMIPITLLDIKNKSILDLCSAPGGKAFQALTESKNIILNDINKKRIQKLEQNLDRLNFFPDVYNYNALNFPKKQLFDIVLLDAPCSAIGTIRSNPEIFFKNKKPNLNKLFDLQQDLIQKSSLLLKKEGILVYMVCSFFFSETLKPIRKFLKMNKNFKIHKYNLIPSEMKINKFLHDKNDYFLAPLSKYKNYNIDGFFSIQLIRKS